MQQKLREGFERQVSISNLIEGCTLQTYTDHILVIQASFSRLLFQHWMTETGCVIKRMNSSPGKVHASLRLLRKWVTFHFWVNFSFNLLPNGLSTRFLEPGLFIYLVHSATQTLILVMVYTWCSGSSLKVLHTKVLPHQTQKMWPGTKHREMVEWAHEWMGSLPCPLFCLQTFSHCTASPTFSCQLQQNQRCCWQCIRFGCTSLGTPSSSRVEAKADTEWRTRPFLGYKVEQMAAK